MYDVIELSPVTEEPNHQGISCLATSSQVEAGASQALLTDPTPRQNLNTILANARVVVVPDFPGAMGSMWQVYSEDGVEAGVARQIDDLRSLHENWDGEGAPRIREDILQAAERVAVSLSFLGPEAEITPLANGRVQLEWYDGPRTLELEFETPTVIHYLQRDRNKNWFEEDVFSLQIEPRRAQTLLRWFISD